MISRQSLSMLTSSIFTLICISSSPSARQENYNRTSDHYLIYTEHMWDSGRFLLMGLITPAHERMPARDTRLLSYFSEVAEDFHAS